MKNYTANGIKGLCPALIGIILLITISGTYATRLYQNNIQKRLNEQKDIARSVILFNNQSAMIPLQSLETRRIASINAGSVYSGVFDSLLNKYASVKSFSVQEYKSASYTIDDLTDDLKFFNTVIIQITAESVADPEITRFILENQKNKQIILTGFGDVAILNDLRSVTAPIVWSTEYSPVASWYTAQLIFGGVEARGKLDKAISAKYKLHSGFQTKKIRLKYSLPEEVGIRSADLNEIDAIAAEAIRERATPGAVVMVIKDGHVIFNKAYGSHTYAGNPPTKVSDIFDLASVTKTSATTMAVMRLFEQNKLKLDTNVGAYIPKARKTDKNDISVREVLLHQAGFVPYIPFYRRLTAADHSRDSSYAFPVKVADGYFLRRDYFKEVMWPEMLNVPVKTRGKYVYSDLSMYYMKEIVERQSGEPLNHYVATQFYQPLGMYTAGFNPRYRFEKDKIVPTERDTAFRDTLLQGYVHDQGAAMVNGVSGHAGLFASANDLGILYQMVLNRGTYGGIRYFKPETIDMFTSRQSDVSRRGLGFDRWDPKPGSEYPSKLASPQTFGHTGYTGIGVWADPKYNLIYIFLSNRVHPSVDTKLYTLNIRSRIQDVVYEAIRKARR